MKCPKCGNELEEGKLLCEQCGEEIKIVPDFDIELEAQMDETISNIVENISVDENSQQDAEADEPQKTEADEQEDADDLKETTIEAAHPQLDEEITTDLRGIFL